MKSSGSGARVGAFFVALVLFLSACVTINIYFPAAAAEEAAEKIVEDVLGTKAGQSTPPPPADEDTRGSHVAPQSPSVLVLLDWIIPTAQAAPNFDVDTPAVRKIQARMKARNNDLRPFYQSGAAGFGKDGLVKVRDASKVGIKDRKKFDKLVKAENADRNALYREIAKANGHPEWEPEIRDVFAKQWRDKARSGWWIQDGSGKWRKK